MRATASKVALLTRCQAWAKESAQWTDTTSEAAALGIELHEASEAFISTRQPIVVSAAARVRWAHLLDWLSANVKIGWRAEVAFAWDPSTDTAVELGARMGRNYPRDHRLCGAADIVSMDGDRVVIYDVKTGHSIDNVWDQMGTLGLMAARAYHASRVKLVVIHVTDEGVYAHESEMTEFDLAAMSGTLAHHIEGIPSSAPKPGSWCSSLYCPHIAHCSATNEAVAQLLPVESLVRHKLSTSIQSPEHAAWMLHRVEALLEMGDQIREALKTYARANGGISCGDGKTWTEVPSVRQNIDGKAALALAEKSGADPFELGACMKSTTISSFRKVKARGRAA